MSNTEPTPQGGFCYYLRVRYAECDAQRVVFNVHYGAYIDLAVIEFLRALGLESVLIHGPWDYQLVKQTLEWKSAARFDQVIEVSVRSLRVGNTSFTLTSEFRIAGHEPLLATGETVYVLVDAKTLLKTPISADLRTTLLEGAAGRLVDHANYLPPRR